MAKKIFESKSEGRRKTPSPKLRSLEDAEYDLRDPKQKRKN
jgi:hypothetical protein